MDCSTLQETLDLVRTEKVGKLEGADKALASAADRIIKDICDLWEYQHLAHQSYWLFEILRLPPGLHVITADTGAGKSLLMLGLAKYKGVGTSHLIAHSSPVSSQLQTDFDVVESHLRVSGVRETPGHMMEGIKTLIIDEVTH